jgi:hypothetical protein
MIYVICYNWGICSEVEEKIAKLVFCGDWRPSLLECPRLNFANECDTKLKWMRHYQPTNPLFNQHNYDGWLVGYNYDASLPPRTTPHLDKISIYKENLTKSDILEIKKYYLARVFTARFSAFRAVDGPCKVERLGIIKKPYRKLSIKALTSPVSKYCANHYW